MSLLHVSLNIDGDTLADIRAILRHVQDLERKVDKMVDDVTKIEADLTSMEASLATIAGAVTAIQAELTMQVAALPAADVAKFDDVTAKVALLATTLTDMATPPAPPVVAPPADVPPAA